MKSNTVLSVSFLAVVTLLILCLGSAQAGSIKVVGVTEQTHKGNASLAEQHEACDSTFPGSHWCSTSEYMAGGLIFPADTSLPTAWIRPVIVGAFKNKDNTILIDASGQAANQANLSCRQWASRNSEDMGLTLQTNTEGNAQKVVAKACDRKRPSLCCVGLPDYDYPDDN